MTKKKTLVIVGVAGASLVLYGLWKYFQNATPATPQASAMENGEVLNYEAAAPTVTSNTTTQPPAPALPPITWERNLYTPGENATLENTLTRLVTAIQQNNAENIEREKKLLLRRLEYYATN